MSSKNYPDSLHRYEIQFIDGGREIIHACGGTNAVYIATHKWNNRQIIRLDKLKDSWKYVAE